MDNKTKKENIYKTVKEFGLPYALGAASSLIQDSRSISQASLNRIEKAIEYLNAAKDYILHKWSTK